MINEGPKCKKSLVNQQIQIIPKKLYFLSTQKFIDKKQNYLHFNIDNILEYIPFHQDFGPLKISLIYKYIKEVDKLMDDPSQSQTIFWHVTSTNPKKYVNSVLLICIYQMLKLGKNASEAYRPFETYEIIRFRDSLAQKSVYQCPVIQVLKGFEKAVNLQLFNSDDFDVDSYNKYQKLQNGDINQIIQDKLYAFGAPQTNQKDRFGKTLNHISTVIQKLKQLKIEVIIKLYPAPQFQQKLKKQGFKIHSIQINQNNTPDRIIIDKFCQIIQSENKRIGVFCKTGFGQTGTMISCYAIKCLGFTAPQAIGWLRLFRPGSVLGSQQTFLFKLSNSSFNNKNQTCDKQIKLFQVNPQVNARVSGSVQKRGKNNQHDQKVRHSSINKQPKEQIIGSNDISLLTKSLHIAKKHGLKLYQSNKIKPEQPILSSNDSQTKPPKVSGADDSEQGISPKIKMMLMKRRMNVRGKQ